MFLKHLTSSRFVCLFFAPLLSFVYCHCIHDQNCNLICTNPYVWVLASWTCRPTQRQQLTVVNLPPPSLRPMSSSVWPSTRSSQASGLLRPGISTAPTPVCGGGEKLQDSSARQTRERRSLCLIVDTSATSECIYAMGGTWNKWNGLQRDVAVVSTTGDLLYVHRPWHPPPKEKENATPANFPLCLDHHHIIHDTGHTGRTGLLQCTTVYIYINPPLDAAPLNMCCKYTCVLLLVDVLNRVLPQLERRWLSCFSGCCVFSKRRLRRGAVGEPWCCSGGGVCDPNYCQLC